MITYTVDTDGGGDYTSLSLAEAALPATLADDYTITCTGSVQDTTEADFTGSTVGSYTITVTPATGDEHDGVWNTSKYRIGPSSGSSVYITEANVILDGLQIITPSTDYDYGVRGGAYAGIKFLNLLVDGANNSGTGVYPIYNTNNSVTRNCIVFNASYKGIYAAGDTNLPEVSNCVVIGTSVGFSGSYGSPVFKNCIAVGCTTCFDNKGSDSDYNISSDATAPGTNSLINQVAADIFTDSANGDFTLKVGSNAIGAGVDLSALFTTDITGATRVAPWDIGAFIYAISGGSTSSMVTSWKLFNASQRSTAWRTLAAATASTAWRIFNTLNKPTAWKTFNSADKDLAWRSFNSTSADTAWKMFLRTEKATAWKTFNSTEAGTAWMIYNTAARDTAWKILNAGSASLETAWQIYNTANKATAWSVQTQAELETAWKIINSGSAAISTAWKIYNAESTDTAWKMFAKKTAATAWNIFNVSESSTAWRIKAQIQRETGWQIFNSADLSTAWALNSELIPEPVKIFLAESRTVAFKAATRTIIFFE